MAIQSDIVDADSWTEHELQVLKTLVALNFPMDVICMELGRSWTASALKVIDLGLNNGLSQRAKHMVRRRQVKVLQN